MYLLLIDEDCTRDLKEFLLDTLVWCKNLGVDYKSKNINEIPDWREYFLEVRPRIIHALGSRVGEIKKVADELGIPFITGITSISEENSFASYSISSMVTKKGLPILYPVSLLTHSKTFKRYVLLFNIDERSIDLILFLLAHLQGISFMICGAKKKEYGERIVKAIESRPTGARCVFLEEWVTTTVFESAKLVLIPYDRSLFCRVASHALATGTPIVATDTGYNSHMLRDTAVLMKVQSSNEEWRDVVRNICTDSNMERVLRSKSIERHASFTEGESKRVFKNIIEKAVEYTCKVMIITVWGDEGVGVWGRNYAKFLLDCNIEVCVLSPRSKYSHDKQRRFQVCKEEWNFPNIPVHYSENDIDSITKYEAIAMAEKYRSRHAIFLGEGNDNLGEMAESLKERGIWVYKTVNTPRNSINYDFNLGEIGYSVYGPTPKENKPDCTTLNFLAVCGRNLGDRKRAAHICRAFLEYFNMYGRNVSLTLTTFGEDVDLSQYSKISGIKIINRIFSRGELRDLFLNSHVNICVSKKEDLAAEIYEGLSTGTYTLSLNCEPYKSILREGVNSTLVECRELMDGTGHDFRILDLLNKIVEIRNGYNEEYYTRTITEYKRRFSMKAYKLKMHKIFYLV